MNFHINEVFKMAEKKFERIANQARNFDIAMALQVAWDNDYIELVPGKDELRLTKEGLEEAELCPKIASTPLENLLIKFASQAHEFLGDEK